MEEILFSKFYFGFWLYLAFVIILCVTIIILFLFKGKLSAEHHGKRVFWIGLCVLVIALVYVSVEFVNYCLDLTYVKNGKYETFTGEVIGYTYIAEGNSPKEPILGDPIFRDTTTNEVKVLIVQRCEVGKTYTIIYLPHTRLAKIVEP